MENKELNCAIYVVHALQGYEIHERHVNELFKEYGLAFEFVTDGDISLFTDEILHKYFTQEFIDNPKKGTISLALNHILSYEKFLQTDYPFAIVFEDDPFFLRNFHKNLTKIIAEAKTLEPGFIISLENTSLKFPGFCQMKPKKHLYRARKGRMAGAYMIDRVGAESALRSLEKEKCFDGIDWWHNFLVENHVLKMYWAQPAISEQGSHNGLLQGNISTRSKSKKRRYNWLLQKFYKSYIRRIFPSLDLISKRKAKKIDGKTL